MRPRQVELSGSRCIKMRSLSSLGRVVRLGIGGSRDVGLKVVGSGKTFNG